MVRRDTPKARLISYWLHPALCMSRAYILSSCRSGVKVLAIAASLVIARLVHVIRDIVQPDQAITLQVDKSGGIVELFSVGIMEQPAVDCRNRNM